MLLFNCCALHKCHQSLKSISDLKRSPLIHVVAGTMQHDDTLHFSICYAKYSINYKKIF